MLEFETFGDDQRQPEAVVPLFYKPGAMLPDSYGKAALDGLCVVPPSEMTYAELAEQTHQFNFNGDLPFTE